MGERSEHHFRFRRTVFDGITQKIEQRTRDQGLVTFHERDTQLMVDSQPNSGCLRQRLQDLVDVLQYVNDVDSLQFERP
jgi:hypothetical protein